MIAKLGDLLHAYRKTNGLSQHEMALQLGISQQAFGNIERGTTLPRGRTLARLVDATGYSKEILDAAKVAQYQWNLAANQAELPEAGPDLAMPTDVPPSLVTAPAQVRPRRPADGAAMALLANLTAAMSAGMLPTHQIELLSLMLDNFLVGRPPPFFPG